MVSAREDRNGQDIFDFSFFFFSFYEHDYDDMRYQAFFWENCAAKEGQSAYY